MEISTAVNDNDVSRAVQYLESLDVKYTAKAIWLNLANITFNLQNLMVGLINYGAGQLIFLKRFFVCLLLLLLFAGSSEMFHCSGQCVQSLSLKSNIRVIRRR